MQRSLLWFLVFIAMCGTSAVAIAREPGTVSVEDVRAAIGYEVTADDVAALTDVSEEFGAAFSSPTEVYTGGIYVDFGGERLAFNLDNYVQDGVTRGIDLFYTPEEVSFADLSFEQQQDVYELVYWYILDNHAGENGGTDAYYDDSGGLYVWDDPDGIVWTLRWRAGQELVLSFDEPNFYDEHYSNTILRTASGMAE